jgi:hypothetical protein
VYYYYPVSHCNSSTCQLDVGYVSSTNGGQTWTTKTQLAGPMQLSWLASTSQGAMVGDYMATTIVGGRAFPALASATAPHGGVFDEAMFTVSSGLRISAGDLLATSDGELVGAGNAPASAEPATAN